MKHLLLLATCSLVLTSYESVAQNAAASEETPATTGAGSTANAGAGSTANRPDADMQKVLSALDALGPKPLPQLTAEQARKQPSPADAVKKVMQDDGTKPAPPAVSKTDTTYETAGGPQKIRLYTPKASSSSQKLPVIVYFHGGGWVIADITTYEASAMALASKANAIVASVEYRHAPEAKFPAAHEDSFAAYRWVVENAASFGGDSKRVAVAGESAGGNLAANVAIMARDQKFQKPVHMLLVYPVAGSDMNTPSYIQNADAKPLNKGAMQWFVKQALHPEDAKDPRINLVSANLSALPSATVITAQIDPLRSEGKVLADKLQRAGVQTTYRNYEGVTHEFFGMAPVVADATAAQDLAAQELRAAFASQAQATR